MQNFHDIRLLEAILIYKSVKYAPKYFKKFIPFIIKFFLKI